MAPGEILEQSVDGFSFTSTFAAKETCPNDWVTDDWDCLRFTISDGVDDATDQCDPDNGVNSDLNWTSGADTDHDGDGCQDAVEDGKAWR